MAENMDINSRFTREFAVEVCRRFAFGESIDEIAEESGNQPEEIEALLKSNYQVMQKAVDNMDGGYAPKMMKAAGKRHHTCRETAELMEAFGRGFAEGLIEALGREKTRDEGGKADE